MSKHDLKTVAKEEINVGKISAVEIKNYEFVTRSYNAKSIIGNPSNKDEMIVVWYDTSKLEHKLAKVSIKDNSCKEIDVQFKDKHSNILQYYLEIYHAIETNNTNNNQVTSFQTLNINHLSLGCVMIVAITDDELCNQFFGVYNCNKDVFLQCQVITQRKKAIDHYYIIHENWLLIVYHSCKEPDYNPCLIDTLEVYRLQNEHGYLPVEDTKLFQTVQLFDSDKWDWKMSKQYIKTIYGGFVIDETLVIYGKSTVSPCKIIAIDMELKHTSKKLIFNVDLNRYDNQSSKYVLPRGYDHFFHCYIPSRKKLLLADGDIETVQENKPNSRGFVSEVLIKYIDRNTETHCFDFMQKKWTVLKHKIEFINGQQLSLTTKMILLKGGNRCCGFASAHVGWKYSGTKILTTMLSQYQSAKNWRYERVLWIGFYKNDKNEKCYVDSLPKDLLKLILRLGLTVSVFDTD